jgi:uncharacterized protein (TIGR02145 family)
MKSNFILYVTILTSILVLSCKEKPVPPVISTTPISAISTTAAVSGGNVTDDGGAPVSSRGICWNTSDSPVITNNKTTDSEGSGSFTSNLTQLIPSTTYFVRAYATNSSGTSYGSSVSFKTLGDKPASTAVNATSVLTTSATLNGTVNPNSLTTTVTFEYGLTTSYGGTAAAAQSPLSADANGNITATLTGLTPGTIYHFRVKAENSLGITYSGDITFTTLGQLPSVTTLTATNIQLTSVTLNATINPNYLSTNAVFQWGIAPSYGNMISFAQNPLTGSTPVNVSAELTGLTPGTTYHYNIRGDNNIGISGGNDITFKTLGGAPIAVTPAVSNLQMITATLKGFVNPNYFNTAVSFEYGTTLSYGSIINVSQGSLTGSSSTPVSADISGLTQGTIYHLRIKATNELGTTLSEDMTFTTLAPITDIDGNVYGILTIGTQVWMAENLKTTKYRNGDAIPNITDSLIWNHLSTGAYCDYDNTPSNSIIYGKLYNWYTVDDPRNLCPSGWHAPKGTEWTTLLDFLEWNNITGGKLKETGLAHWNYPNTGANNESGFTALPGGLRAPYGFIHIINTGVWWAARDYWWNDSTGPLSIYLWYNRSDFGPIFTSIKGKNDGESVRCLKD